MKKIAITFTTDINESRITVMPVDMCPIEYVTDVLGRDKKEIESIKIIKD